MTRINLLPWREHLREEQKRQFFLGLGAVAVFAVSFMLVVHMTIASQIHRQESRNAFLRYEITTLNSQIAEIKDLKRQKEALIARMSIIQELQANRPRIVHLFDELVKVLPDGIHLTEVVCTGDTVVLVGKAESNTNVSDLMRNIEKSIWLAQPQLSEIKKDSDDKKTISEFKVSLLLVHPDMVKGNTTSGYKS